MTFVFRDGAQRADLRRSYDREARSVTPEVRAIFEAEDKPLRDAQEQHEADLRARQAANEARAMENANSERYARLTGSGILPETIASLDHLPKSFHDQYERNFDGSYRLAYVLVTDTANFHHHMNAIASGKITARQAGWKPENDRRDAKAREKMTQDILADVNQRTADQRERERQAEIERETAKVNARYGR